MKTIGIFTDNELIVLRTAIDIINDYEKAGVTVTKQTRTKFDLYVDFSDGTKVEWIKPNLNSRGHKVTDGYIDISTCSREAITNIILPCIMDIDKEPEIVIIDSNPSRKDYDLDTLILIIYQSSKSFCLISQLKLKFLIWICIKNFAKNLSSLISICQ